MATMCELAGLAVPRSTDEADLHGGQDRGRPCGAVILARCGFELQLSPRSRQTRHCEAFMSPYCDCICSSTSCAACFMGYSTVDQVFDDESCSAVPQISLSFAVPQQNKQCDVAVVGASAWEWEWSDRGG